MTAVAGLRGSGDWGTDERPKNFRELILWRNPNGTAPLFALCSKVKKRTVDDPEFSWWDEPNDIVRLQVNGALSSVDTTIVVDSGDPTSAAPGNRWGTATNLKAGDTLMVEPATDSATFSPEMLEVVSVTDATTFVVKRGVAGTTAATIANDVYLLKIGSAYGEGTGAPKATTRNPVKYTNLIQIFKDTYEITGTAVETRVRTGDPLKNDKKRKAFDHARDIEHAMLFGQQYEATDDVSGKPKRYMGGLRSFISSATSSILTTGWTLNDLLDAVSPVFDFDTEAGDTRIVFAGNGAINAFNKKIMDQSNAAQITYAGTAKLWNMNFREYTIPTGSLMIKTHPLLNRNTLYTNSWFIIDFSALTYVAQKGRDTRMNDNVQNKDEDLRRGYWQSDCSLEVDYAGLTCGYIGGFNK